MRPNLDLIAKGSFQTAPDGTRLFYPNGFAGKGYVIDSETQYRRLFVQQKRWGLAIMAIITALVAARVGWAIMLPLFVGLNLLKQYVVRQTTRDMRVSDIPYSIDGFFRDGLRLPHMSHDMLLFLLVISGGVALACLTATLYLPAIWRGAFPWIFFSLLLGYLVLRELRGNNERTPPALKSAQAPASVDPAPPGEPS